MGVWRGAHSSGLIRGRVSTRIKRCQTELTRTLDGLDRELGEA
jgi:hypothetical protein